MSGAEISEQIEKQTGGRWKPSPGSIYPLLAWMLKKGFTKESPKVEEGFKRYSFTVKGSKFFEKQIAVGEGFLYRMEFLLPMLIGGLQFGSNKQKLDGTRAPVMQLIGAFLSIRHNLGSLSQGDAEEMVKAIGECSAKLDELAKRVRNENRP